MVSLISLIYTMVAVVCFSMVKETYERQLGGRLSKNEEYIVILCSVFWFVSLIMLAIYHTYLYFWGDG